VNNNEHDRNNETDSIQFTAPPTELFELLADRSLVGLDDLETRRLEVLLAEHPWVRHDCMDDAAARLADAFEQEAGCSEEVPDDVASRIKAGIHAEASSKDEGTLNLNTFDQAPANPIGWAGWVGWTAAAAALVFAATLWQPPVRSIQSSTQLVSWVEEHPDAVRWDWSPGLVNPAEDVTGYVTFSPEAQEGYMMIKGLEPNDPRIQQYQLWIWDKEREPDPENPQPLAADVHPVDGGVFDVNSEGEVVIPITLPLRVGTPYLFAVTVERPGGVVKSDKSSVPIIAGPPADA
jgi:hypothetical protein